MRTTRIMRKRIIHKNKKKIGRNSKKGGFFNVFKSNQPVLPDDCDPTQLSMIKDSSALHQQYQKCCPKRFLGAKNSSPYCKQLDLNFQSALKQENDANELNTVVPSAQLPKTEYDVNEAQTKPWYKFWGGKKTMKHRKTKKTMKHRKTKKTSKTFA